MPVIGSSGDVSNLVLPITVIANRIAIGGSAIAIPSETQAGDLLLVVQASRSGYTLPTPSGFTDIYVNNSASSGHLASHYMFISGTPPSSITAGTDSSSVVSLIVLRNAQSGILYKQSSANQGTNYAESPAFIPSDGIASNGLVLSVILKTTSTNGVLSLPYGYAENLSYSFALGAFGGNLTIANIKNNKTISAEAPGKVIYDGGTDTPYLCQTIFIPQA